MKWKKAFLIITVIWILFIWFNSVMPGDISGDTSGFITRIFQQIFGNIDNLEHYIRKAAHFTEYAVLGMLVFADIYSIGSVLRKLPVVWLVCLTTAFVDETIQLFSQGRNGAVSDMWIDVSGAVFGFILLTLLSRIKKAKI